MVGFSGEADKMFANANQTASEAFSNIRTVCIGWTRSPGHLVEVGHLPLSLATVARLSALRTFWRAAFVLPHMQCDEER